MAAAPAGHQLAIGQRANVVAPSSPQSVFTLPRLQEPDDLAADGAGRTDCSLQEGNRVAFEGSQAELGGGGDGLAEQPPGPLKITRLVSELASIDSSNWPGRCSRSRDDEPLAFAPMQLQDQ